MVFLRFNVCCAEHLRSNAYVQIGNIQCRCDEQLKSNYFEFLRLKRINPSLKQEYDFTHHCHDCISPETLSLLLCGKPRHANMMDWFGVGFLSGDIVEDKDSVSDKLFKSPSRHVWIVQGKYSYFTLWSGQREDTKSIVNASYSFELKSWNSWDEGLVCIGLYHQGIMVPFVMSQFLLRRVRP